MTVNIPDLTGKVALVTGGNSGIGAETVKRLAAANATCVYICSRSKANADTLAETIRKEHPKANLESLVLDLSSFDSVRECAAEFNRKSDRLDLLFLNAGVSARRPGLTTEGYEYQFGINHMGHALLAQLLMPKLLTTQRQGKPGDVRILVTSSKAANNSRAAQGIAVDLMKEPDAFGSTMQKYSHSKLANIFFAQKLAQVYPSITSVSMHPGVVFTSIWDKADGMTALKYIGKPIVWLFGMTVAQGAETMLWCATAKVGEDGVVNGAYYEPVGKLKEMANTAVDQKQTEELWEWTEKELASHGGPGWPAA